MYDSELKVAKSIAEQAGKIMRQYFYEGQQRQIKQDGTPLTIADTLINQLVIAELSKAFAEDIVIGEEASTGTYGPGRRWLCDPIDGTKAFTWGVPTAMFSLGLVIDGRPVLGVCLEPMLDKLYWAVRGEGAFCNGEALKVNNSDLSDGILATISNPYRLRRDAPYMDALLDVSPRIDMATFSGAVAKSIRVAEGRFVGYIEEMVNPHDMAAVDVIVREAGGRITGFNGEELNYTRQFKGAVVSNGLVHDKILNATSA